MVTRARTLGLLVAALFGASGCNAILGIGSHALALDASAPSGMDGAADTSDGPAETGDAPTTDGDGDADGAPNPCSSGGWCPNYVPPKPDALNAVWSRAHDDTWAVGDSGTILHWNGAVWAVTPGISSQSLAGVWGSGPNDVWAVGFDSSVSSAVILRWDGVAWTNVSGAASTFRLDAVWGSAADDVWAVGAQGTILHWNGAQWSRDTSASLPPISDVLLTAVWGTGPTDVWIVGSSGTLLHWDGRTWSATPKPDAAAPPNLRGIWGDSSANVWVVGDGGTILHFDGIAWSPPSTASPTTQDLFGVWGPKPTFDAMGHSIPGDVWAVGAAGTILRLRNDAWSSVPGVTDQNLRAVAGSESDDAWAVGDGDHRIQWLGNAWLHADACGLPGDSVLRSLWGSASNDVWAVGEGGNIVHWDGSAWFIVSSFAANTITDVVLNRVWGSGANDVWIVGAGGTILHWNGAAWCLLESGSCEAADGSPIVANPNQYDLYGVWGSGPNDVWVVGQVGSIWRWDGKTWIDYHLTTVSKQLNAVWGSSATNMVVVGEAGTVLRWDGTTWSAPPELQVTDAFLNAVWGSGPDDVWIVGDRETLRRLRPNDMSVDDNLDKIVPGANSVVPSFLGIWGEGDNNAWVVGEVGTIWTWDGMKWSKSDSGVQKFLATVWGSSPSDVWVMGEDGAILHF